MGQSFQEEFSDLLLLKMLRSATEASKDKDKVWLREGGWRIMVAFLLRRALAALPAGCSAPAGRELRVSILL